VLARCIGGADRGTVRNIDVVDLHSVDVLVDLNFGRVTHLSTPPQLQPAAGQQALPVPTIRYLDDLADASWYTGRCPWFSFG
jgi:hypothetical protein